MALQYQVDRLIPRYKKCGLQMNASKCKTIILFTSLKGRST